MNTYMIGFELRQILKTWVLSLPDYERAAALIRQLEEAAANALLDEVRRLGT